MSLSVQDVINVLREQVSADYGRLNVELAVARAEVNMLRSTLKQLQSQSESETSS